MKNTRIVSCLGLAAAFVLPFFFGRFSSAPAPASPVPALAAVSAAPVPSPAVSPETLAVLTPEGLTEMELEEYLLGVIAAEMPASFEREALKAQAVAARSYALYCAKSGRHGGAVCTDHNCCQSWLGDDALKAQWGENYELYRGSLAAAASATAGQYLSYNGEPVFAAFHSSSAAATEDCSSVWAATPYLVSVSSPETADDVPGYVSYVRCTPLDFRDTVLYAYPEADFTSAESQWVGGLSRDASGRVASAILGGVSVDGVTLRSLFKLRSTAFELCYDGESFLFTVTGYGHGVGMSQYGANVMAREGADYTEILAHYYTGTTLVS